MQASPATLGIILADARRRAAELGRRRPELERRAAQAPPAHPFGIPGQAVGLIAEIKRRSPSFGDISPGLDPVTHATAYARGGAIAVSVLTDPDHFGGSLADLEAVAGAVALPVLRKDFIVHEDQLLEARGAGASAVLLIVRALEQATLRSLAKAAKGLGLATLVEAHDERELDRALAADPSVVGVNARDLGTFTIDLSGAARLIERIPAGVPVVAESGIEKRADVERAARAGADFVLVGTSVARAANPELAVRDLVGVPRRGRET
jgi:indole-3-glycerol phosphate synthase